MLQCNKQKDNILFMICICYNVTNRKIVYFFNDMYMLQCNQQKDGIHSFDMYILQCDQQKDSILFNDM